MTGCAPDPSARTRNPLLSLAEAADLAAVDVDELESAVRAGSIATTGGGRRGALVTLDELGRHFPAVRSRAHLARGGGGRDQVEQRLAVLHENARLLRMERDEAQRARRELAEHLRGSRAAQEDAEQCVARERTAADALATRLAIAERRVRRRGAFAAGCGIALVAVLALRRPLTPRAAEPDPTASHALRDAPATLASTGSASVPLPLFDGPHAPAPTVVLAPGAIGAVPSPVSAPVSAPVAGETTDTQHEPGAEAPDVGAEPGPEPGDAVDETVSARPAAPQATGPACRFSAQTGPGSELRALLGPCLGPWNPELGATVGGHVVHGKRYCAQHVLLARAHGGSLERARELARVAEGEGLAPPLVQRRIARSVARFLRQRAGEWTTAGFEAGVLDEHRPGGPSAGDGHCVESWAILPGADGARRRFRMELELSDGPHADRLVTFAWLDDLK